MTLFEYLSVAVSIVFSLSAAQILGSLRNVLRTPGRYGPHVVWVFVTLYLHPLLWWEFWAYRDLDNWSLFYFMGLLFNPALLYIASNALVVPDDEHDGNWEAHYYAVRRPFFLIYFAIVVFGVVRDAWLLDSAFGMPKNLPEATLAICFAVAAVTSDRRVHVGIAAMGAVMMLVASVLLWLQPGGASTP